jgi:predicted RNA-binding Zn-ribbon protein involved in translation (DUF1610 family)
MTDLERFAAALLAQWRADGGKDGGPIAVSALLTRVLPYRVARRSLGIDVSEDYEALVLRLLSEEQDLVRVEPVDAADMARATISSKLPDLDVLQLLRAATMTLTDRTIARLDGVLPMPTPKNESMWAEQDVSPGAEPAPLPRSSAIHAAEIDARPPGPANDDDVIPLRAEREASPAKPAPAGPPPAFLTTVSFTPPAAERCWSCAESLPIDRPVKFCPFCGADQRQPACAACGAGVDRKWKHCPDCGVQLWSRG